MPNSIPYDHPSLTLGGVVDPKLMAALSKINGLQNQIDDAYASLNANIQLKRSFAMTRAELEDMGVDVTDLASELDNLNGAIQQAATQYMKVSLKAEKSILAERATINALETDEVLHSPVDFGKSDVKRLPLSSDSLKLDAQYFSYSSSGVDQALQRIQQFVKQGTSNTAAHSNDIAQTVSDQVAQQANNHNLSGTLIITASCTHREVAVLEPLVLDPDHCVDLWDALKGTSMPVDDLVQMETLARGKGGTESMSYLNGVVYGSSYVGMVHTVNSESSTDNIPDEQLQALQERLRLGGWLQHATGGFGVDATVAAEVRRFLAVNAVSSHVSLVTMGALPSIASNQVQLGLNKFIDKQPTVLSSSSSSTDSASTISSEAEQARKGQLAVSVEHQRTEAIMSGLQKIDLGANQVMDVNSLMVAFENYLKSIQSDKHQFGVPIGFYQKQLTQRQIAKLWLQKYHPGTAAESTIKPSTD